MAIARLKTSLTRRWDLDRAILGWSVRHWYRYKASLNIAPNIYILTNSTVCLTLPYNADRVKRTDLIGLDERIYRNTPQQIQPLA